jgi:hypothetical protein
MSFSISSFTPSPNAKSGLVSMLHPAPSNKGLELLYLLLEPASISLSLAGSLRI